MRNGRPQLLLLRFEGREEAEEPAYSPRVGISAIMTLRSALAKLRWHRA